MSFITNPISNLHKAERKYQALHQKYSDSLFELRKLKRQLKETRLSRDTWKEKAKKRNHSLQIQQKKRSKAYLQHSRPIAEGFQSSVSGSKYPFLLILLSILFRTRLRLSYRSIAALWNLLNSYLSLGLASCPCANTIQTWVQKTGLLLLEEMGENLQTKSCTIIADESMHLGNEKVLLLLALPSQVREGSSAVLQHSDVEVLQVCLYQSLKAEDLAQRIGDQITAKKTKCSLYFE